MSDWGNEQLFIFSGIPALTWQFLKQLVNSVTNENVHDKKDSFNTKFLNSKIKYLKHPVHSVPEY